MALIAVSGHPGCRYEELARLTAQRLGFELLTALHICSLTEEQFGAGISIPAKSYSSLITSVVARLATEHHLVCCVLGGELEARHFPGLLRVHVVAPEAVRIGNLMIDRRLDRQQARTLLLEQESASRTERKAKFGKTKATADAFDIVLNAEAITTEQMAEIIAGVVETSGLADQGYLSRAAEAQLQFQTRLKLARFGLVPKSQITLRKKIFSHPSEEIFANLLDFYRIAWEYEPRSFPIQLDRDGRALESFTPDFYLPEFDLYVELTTMKQSLVTRKNRKVRLLRALYPQINIQVFYQKDIENLIFKYGLSERPVEA
jgi:cytidylate kinase